MYTPRQTNLSHQHNALETLAQLSLRNTMRHFWPLSSQWLVRLRLLVAVADNKVCNDCNQCKARYGKSCNCKAVRCGWDIIVVIIVAGGPEAALSCVAFGLVKFIIIIITTLCSFRSRPNRRSRGDSCSINHARSIRIRGAVESIVDNRKNFVDIDSLEYLQGLLANVEDVSLLLYRSRYPDKISAFNPFNLARRRTTVLWPILNGIQGHIAH